ncbi:Oligopeptide transport system permease protein OppC [Geobacillus thermodenitrificans]|jgi:peptide/nickel transport system permease protein|uniref:ABC transporter permease n=1 Tax=Geobacillus thermodenitrificans TaxID=33940 RepID=UPI000A28DDF8|nr:ABC transporter permease [Geobacillus thermodenitrificans]ARP42948.1 Oligopeptide transport system permease protein OppC [Geobacillus thermodenitrificans]
MILQKGEEALFRPIDRRSLQSAAVQRPSLSFWKEVCLKIIKNKMAMFGALLLLCIVIMAIIGPHLVPYSYDNQDLTNGNKPPSSEHWFGTDDLGRDMWSRTWYGARISLTVGLIAALIDLVIGVLVGGVSGYMAGRGKLGDRIDNILMRIVEVLYGIPYLLVVILLMVVMEPGLWTIIIALSITGWIGMARIIRGQILQLKQQEYVLAAQKLGTSHAKIIFRHLLPNALGIIIVNLTFTIPQAIFAESFLSFLGLGVQAPFASWGTMANDALGVILSGQWWRLFFPGLMISLTMFAFNIFGDGLQDALDPRRK